MQSRIEPPILLSRLLLFVFAGTAVVLFVLLMTLQNMFPLVQPQIFFVTTKSDNFSSLVLTSLPPVDRQDNLEKYKQAFIMEYIRARNEIEPNISVMRRKWGNRDGLVAAWSTPAVYAAFRKTALVTALTSDYPTFDFVCPVEFSRVPYSLRNDRSQYIAEFKYFCDDNDRQTRKKTYKIRLGLQFDENASIGWQERLNNPLGIRVSEYIIEGGDGDPLDTVNR